MEVRVRRLVVGPLATNTYVVEVGGSAIVVDPGDEAETILRIVKGLRVEAIIATHGHFDHVGAVADLVRELNAPFLMHRRDWEIISDLVGIGRAWGFDYPEPPQPKFVDEGDEVLGFRIMHLPGHTPGSIALIGYGLVFSGDTLFKDAHGRTDLPHGDEESLVDSLCRLIKEVPHSYSLYPGHGPPSTVGREAAWIAQLFRCGQRDK